MTGDSARKVTVVITGANSAVGLAILRCAPSLSTSIRFIAAVRSDRAIEEIRRSTGITDGLVRISYDVPDSLDAAFHGAVAVIHLPGVLIERTGSTYEQVHIGTTRSVVGAARRIGVAKLVFVSAVGADERSTNRYWRTKGEAEREVRLSGLSYTVLRAPLLLGPGTEGSAALQRHAARGRATLIGGGRQIHQPLDVEDLARAAVAASRPGIADGCTLDIVGLVSLTERELVERVARLQGSPIRIRSVPKRLVSALLTVRGLTRQRGFSPDALDVITADTRADPRLAPTALGIELTGLDDLIRKSLGQRGPMALAKDDEHATNTGVD